MDKYVIRTNKNPPSESSSSMNNMQSIEQASVKRARVDVDFSDELIGDPGKRIPIDSYPVNMRDSMRRRYLAKGPTQPSGHDFPFTQFGEGPSNRRRFQVKWYARFPWLEYSVFKDAAFCLHCYLFASGNKFGDGALTHIGFKNWKKALDSYKLHQGGTTSSHHYARQKVVQYQNQRENVDHVLASKCSAMEAEYRIRLTAIVHVVRFLLEAGAAFWGHDESKESKRPGNFLLLIKWYCARDKAVKKVMDNAPGNNRLTSGTIQKQIIDACGSETRKVILNEIGNKFFSLLIDEARDCSVKEQMAVVLRFVNDSGEVIERFLDIIHVSNTSAPCLKNAIDDFFASNRLSFSRLRGQGYDGASNMRGKFNGLKALILNENKHAHYIHCFAHQLQSVVIAAATKKCKPVKLFFDIVPIIVNIVGASCKRKDILRELHHDKVVEQVEKGEISTGKGKNQEISLSRPGETRWGSHYKTIVQLFQMWDSVIKTLVIIANDKNENSQATADSLVTKMLDFEFVLVGKLTARLLGLTNELSQFLQVKNQNIVHAMEMVKVVKSSLQAYREDGWEELLKEVTEFCESKDIHVPNMEDIIPSRARKLLDGSMTYFHRFRRDIFLEAVNAIASEMDHRFSESTCELLLCISCLDPSNSFAKFDRDRLLHLAKLYSEDFSNSEIVELDHQLSLYIYDMRSNKEFSKLGDIGELAKKMVERQNHIFYHLVYRLIELALVIPVTTATVERCFSAMNLVKTDLRNRMDDDYLSDCLLCYIENTTFNSVEDEAILQNFQNQDSRRQDLPDKSAIVSSSSVVNK